MEKPLKRKSIHTKIFGTIFLSIFLITAVLGYLSFRLSKDRLVRMIGESSKGVASTTANFITREDLSLIKKNMEGIIKLRRAMVANKGFLNTLADIDETGDTAVAENLGPVVDKYNQYVKLLSGVKNANIVKSTLNIYIREGNRLTNMVSSEPALLMGAQYKMAPAAKEALESGAPLATGIYKDKDGIWISAYAPIPSGVVGATALIEVNDNIALYLDKLRKELILILLACFIAFFGTVALSYRLVDRLIANIRKLNDFALNLDRENYNIPIDIRSEDEVGHLADTFEKLRISIKKKIDDLRHSLVKEKRAHLESIIALTNAMELRDPYTSKHLYRVDKYAILIAGSLGLPHAEVERLRYGCYLHDIGKIYLKDSDFQKGALSQAELKNIRAHAEKGAKIITGIPFFENVKDMVMYHQERYDGTGYPGGLKGEAIPILARIVAVADAFDAMTTDRPYKAKIGFGAAMDVLEKNAGTQFDPVVVNAFLKYRNTIEKIAKKHF
ncbi:MAG: HD domain-containing protein [Candidatus Omnitrophica bacterium]|nr:HD domain-containing protein [Candidatus Omnitrophota bacterium]